MSTTQNLAYAAIQVVHNLGAIAAVGGSLAAAKSSSVDARERLAWLALAGWGTQGVSGAAFGAVSYYFYHQLPDISGIAVAALMVKMVCAATGFLLLAAYLFRGGNWPGEKRSRAWFASSALAVTALSAAAFLRWFS